MISVNAHLCRRRSGSSDVQGHSWESSPQSLVLLQCRRDQVSLFESNSQLKGGREMMHCQQTVFWRTAYYNLFFLFSKGGKLGIVTQWRYVCPHETVWETVRNGLGNELRVEDLGALSRVGAVSS